MILHIKTQIPIHDVTQRIEIIKNNKTLFIYGSWSLSEYEILLYCSFYICEYEMCGFMDLNIMKQYTIYINTQNYIYDENYFAFKPKTEKAE